MPSLSPNVTLEKPSFIAAISLSRISSDPVPVSEVAPTVIFRFVVTGLKVRAPVPSTLFAPPVKFISSADTVNAFEPIVRSSSPTSKSNKKKRRKKSNYVESKKFVGRNRVFGSLNVSDMKKTLQNKMGVYRRKFKTDSNGQRYDNIDNRPFSSDFSFSRFLVPYLNSKIVKKQIFEFDVGKIDSSDPSIKYRSSYSDRITGLTFEYAKDTEVFKEKVSAKGPKM